MPPLHHSIAVASLSVSYYSITMSSISGKKSIHKSSTPSGSSPTSAYIVFAVKVLLILLILFMLPKLVQARNRRHKRARLEVRNLRTQCQNEVCSIILPPPQGGPADGGGGFLNFVPPEESMNCINLCISPVCYEKVYNIHPLEDGEIDLDRFQAFDDCAQEEMRNLRRQQQQQRWV